MRPGKPYERFVLWLEHDFFTRLEDLGDDLTACFLDSAAKRYKLIRPDGELLTQLRRLCGWMVRLQQEHTFGSQTLQYAAVTEFLVYLNRAYFDTPEEIRRDVTENEQVNQVLEYIEGHLAEDLSVEGLAQTFHMSKYHFNAKFKQFTGLTLYQYIMKKRLTIARNMLRGGQSVMDACLGCGFNDYSNFLKAFKREFGHLPKEYMPTK